MFDIKDISVKSIRKKLEKSLDEDRYEHTLGVAKTAQMLACLYDEDANKAYIAGLLHDCAKNLSAKEKIKICNKYDVEIRQVEKTNPSLLHSKAGAILAQKEYDIDDEDILNAIRSHTTGRPNMSKLEKIVFISDYIEPGRPFRTGITNARNLAFKSLDAAVISILNDTLEYLSDSDKAIDPMTQDTFNYYKDAN